MKKTSSRKKGARLGQHFLTGAWAAAKLAHAIGVRSGETIVEIGPGKGALTKELLELGAPVVAIEKDPALIAILQETFAAQIAAGSLRIVPGDVRDLDIRTLPTPYVIAANIPYYITGEIIRMFLTAQPQPRALALLIQKEVAERIIARDGKESLLSLSVKAFGTPHIIAKVSRGNFSPPPSVDSAILHIDAVSRDFFAQIDEALFFEIVRAGFSSKRKLLASNLKKAGFTVPGHIAATARAEDLSLAQWKEIALSQTAHSS